MKLFIAKVFVFSDSQLRLQISDYPKGYYYNDNQYYSNFSIKYFSGLWKPFTQVGIIK